MSTFLTDKPSAPKRAAIASKRKAADPIPHTVIKPKVMKKSSTSTNSKVNGESQDPVYLEQPKAEVSLKICSWNVAGLRAWVKKDGLSFLTIENPDIFCLQVKTLSRPIKTNLFNKFL